MCVCACVHACVRGMVICVCGAIELLRTRSRPKCAFLIDFGGNPRTHGTAGDQRDLCHQSVEEGRAHRRQRSGMRADREECADQDLQAPVPHSDALMFSDARPSLLRDGDGDGTSALHADHSMRVASRRVGRCFIIFILTYAQC